jgi:drug/metabolite transporter (DMT)-like permease
MAYAFATGLCGGMGNIALLEALNRGGDVSTVLPLTGVFPLVTVVLAMLLLKERPNGLQFFGIGLAVAAIVLFSAEDGTAQSEELPWWRNLVAAWMAFALMGLVLYGIAGVTQKLATNDISCELATVCFAAAFVAIAAMILVTQRFPENISGKEWFLAVLFGSLIGVAMIVQFAAYSLGKASVVTPLMALYPAVTVVLAVGLFGEKLDARKVTAILLAIAAAAALGYEGKPHAAESAGATVPP